MRQFIALVLAATLSVAVAAQSASERRRPTKSFFLEDFTAQKWCGFNSQALWKSKVQSLSARSVATVEYTNTHVSSIEVTEESESGDWIVYDDYSVSSGKLIRLQRKSNVLPENVSVEQVFRIENGRGVVEKTDTRDLKSGKPIKNHDVDLPAVPIIVDLQKFPFSALMGTRIAPGQKQETCVSVKQKFTRTGAGFRNRGTSGTSGTERYGTKLIIER